MSKQNEVPIRCKCGKLRGAASDVEPRNGVRIVCYCDDCQAFAHFLGVEGVLDAQGGTDIFQMAPGRLRIEDIDALRCVRLSAKGMYRWYCGSCKTPLGNTLGGRVPFVGLIGSILDHESTGRSRDELLGKPIGYVHTRFAIGTAPEKSSMGRVLAFSARRLAKWWLTGAGAPSPFFDARTREPRVAPQVLSASERQALKGPVADPGAHARST